MEFKIDLLNPSKIADFRRTRSTEDQIKSLKFKTSIHSSNHQNIGGRTTKSIHKQKDIYNYMVDKANRHVESECRHLSK